jgi:hypothetical protein
MSFFGITPYITCTLSTASAIQKSTPTLAAEYASAAVRPDFSCRSSTFSWDSDLYRLVEVEIQAHGVVRRYRHVQQPAKRSAPRTIQSL